MKARFCFSIMNKKKDSINFDCDILDIKFKILQAGMFICCKGAWWDVSFLFASASCLHYYCYYSFCILSIHRHLKYQKQALSKCITEPSLSVAYLPHFVFIEWIYNISLIIAL